MPCSGACYGSSGETRPTQTDVRAVSFCHEMPTWADGVLRCSSGCGVAGEEANPAAEVVMACRSQQAGMAVNTC